MRSEEAGKDQIRQKSLANNTSRGNFDEERDQSHPPPKDCLLALHPCPPQRNHHAITTRSRNQTPPWPGNQRKGDGHQVQEHPDQSGGGHEDKHIIFWPGLQEPGAHCTADWLESKLAGFTVPTDLNTGPQAPQSYLPSPSNNNVRKTQ